MTEPKKPRSNVVAFVPRKRVDVPVEEDTSDGAAAVLRAGLDAAVKDGEITKSELLAKMNEARADLSRAKKSGDVARVIEKRNRELREPTKLNRKRDEDPR